MKKSLLKLSLITVSLSLPLPLSYRHITKCSPPSISSMSTSTSTSLASTINNIRVDELRKEYSSKGLLEDELPNDPMILFSNWFEEACNANVLEPNAMCLATCINNIPSNRYVLLKAHDKRGFVWYTNYNSRKSQELQANPNAAITFWYGEMERSIRIEGIVEKVSSKESDEYFNSRPKSSQIGAWTSNQSNLIKDRIALDKQEKEIIEKFSNVDKIPRPEHWVKIIIIIIHLLIN
jgi:pyridoxamine 5'-phosphate oxidase